MMFVGLDLRLICRRIDVEQRRGTPLLELVSLVRDMLHRQRQAG
jgi:hypothetical protein